MKGKGIQGHEGMKGCREEGGNEGMKDDEGAKEG